MPSATVSNFQYNCTTLYYKLYTNQYSLYTVKYIIHSLHYTEGSIYHLYDWRMKNFPPEQNIMIFVMESIVYCTMHTAQRNLHAAQCTLHSAHGTQNTTQ